MAELSHESGSGTAPRDALSPGETDGSERGGASEESQRGHITAIEGISALSLDAISSVAYGPEAMLTVLATAGAGALASLRPITIAIVVLLAILVLSYRQVIEAYPDGGGCYAVSKANLGPRTSHLAAASLVVDYVLTVAVSISAGVAALVSAFPSLASDALVVSLGILALITALNLRGIATSARAFLLPTAVFVIGIYAVITAGLLRSTPVRGAALHAAVLPKAVAAVGVLLVLKAFAAGCSALTGVEAIANDVPAFKEPRVRRAMRTEVFLGLILGTMLLGLAVLTNRFHIAPSASQTVLSQVTSASIGRGVPYYVIDLSTTVVLALAANTSFGGLPVLASLLARDNLLPHVFGLRAERPVFRYGVVALAVLAGALLVAVNANTNALIPLYAIGVFTGFTLSQVGLVRHWSRGRDPHWRPRVALNGTGAVMTGVSTVIFLVTKFLGGAWVVVIAIPGLMLLFSRIDGYYREAARELGLGNVPSAPSVERSVVIVAVNGVSRLSEHALSAALSMGPDVVALSVCFDDQRADELREEWARWDPGVELVLLRAERGSLAGPIVDYVNSAEVLARGRVIVVIPQVEPRRWRHQLLQNQRGVLLASALRHGSDATVSTLPFRLHD